MICSLSFLIYSWLAFTSDSLGPEWLDYANDFLLDMAYINDFC